MKPNLARQLFSHSGELADQVSNSLAQRCVKETNDIATTVKNLNTNILFRCCGYRFRLISRIEVFVDEPVRVVIASQDITDQSNFVRKYTILATERQRLTDIIKFRAGRLRNRNISLERGERFYCLSSCFESQTDIIAELPVSSRTTVNESSYFFVSCLVPTERYNSQMAFSISTEYLKA
ncbi:hypothetical protein CSKR_112511 [Clonorchis sinensis]|uniref:Uncharacterized protein n=1 Tax=Clonorchis sinensis TaxID=79923 RepID=A0A419Q5E9_CLOSI|nr:hypothetical protein CSKR_112511 [Clonorchis sinensis]